MTEHQIHQRALAERTRLWRATGRLTADDLDRTAAMPPDSYAIALAQRAARSTPASRFEAEYQAQRTAEFATEHRAAEMRAAQQPETPRLTTAELRRYAPPDPYREAIKTRQMKEHRR